MADNSSYPNDVNLDTADPVAIICYLTQSQNSYNGQLGARVSALFVILILSTVATFFPVAATRVPKLRIPIYVYLFARYFGAGVIVCTAFVHLMDPAYAEIGPQTCVGMTGNWASYSWVAGLIVTTVLLVFLMDFVAARFVEVKYGSLITSLDVEAIVARGAQAKDHNGQQSSDQDEVRVAREAEAITDPAGKGASPGLSLSGSPDAEKDSADDQFTIERSFRQQIAAFLILEFGVIFHSVIIGLKLGTAGEEFAKLYPVLVFHQTFEGLGIGARLSAIPIPNRLSWLPWALCTGYGLTTPIAIAIGLGLRTTYDAGSFTASVVAGLLDAISAGILIYTGLVELLARDFLFNPERSKDNKRLAFMVVCVFLGAGLMALLGKWA